MAAVMLCPYCQQVLTIVFTSDATMQLPEHECTKPIVLTVEEVYQRYGEVR